MPAILDDPSAPTLYRTSGEPPYPVPGDASPSLPVDVVPRYVTLRDRQTTATILPFASTHAMPASLLAYLAIQLNCEITGGDTYPMKEPMSTERFAAYWFQNFGAIMLLGTVGGIEDLIDDVDGNENGNEDGNGEGNGAHSAGAGAGAGPSAVAYDKPRDWSRECLGTFYIKPNYPGRSSHVCNAGFVVTDAARNRGAGRLMGEAYIDWAPRLGYTYSVFNLVYETNVASCRIWDGLGFRRIGRVKGCGDLRSHPGRLVDAIIYGRDLSRAEADANRTAAAAATAEALVSDDRFDKIRHYLLTGRYPAGADRAEKSRLRSAATHYKLARDGDVLMLKDKEVIADPTEQYQIARRVHAAGGQHGGINRTTATIAERYHWSRIKETVSEVIRACDGCKEGSKVGSQQQQQQQLQQQRFQQLQYGQQAPNGQGHHDRPLGDGGGVGVAGLENQSQGRDQAQDQTPDGARGSPQRIADSWAIGAHMGSSTGRGGGGTRRLKAGLIPTPTTTPSSTATSSSFHPTSTAAFNNSSSSTSETLHRPTGVSIAPTPPPPQMETPMVSHLPQGSHTAHVTGGSPPSVLSLPSQHLISALSSPGADGPYGVSTTIPNISAISTIAAMSTMSTISPSHTLRAPSPTGSSSPHHDHHHDHNPHAMQHLLHAQPDLHHGHDHAHHHTDRVVFHPIDPQIIVRTVHGRDGHDPQQQQHDHGHGLSHAHTHAGTPTHTHVQAHAHAHVNTHTHSHSGDDSHDHDAEFQALLSATAVAAEEDAVMERDLDMLIGRSDGDEDDEDENGEREEQREVEERRLEAGGAA